MATPPSHSAGPATPAAAPDPAPAPKAAAAPTRAATSRQLTDAVHHLIATTQQFAVSIGNINTSIQGINTSMQTLFYPILLHDPICGVIDTFVG